MQMNTGENTGEKRIRNATLAKLAGANGVGCGSDKVLRYKVRASLGLYTVAIF